MSAAETWFDILNASEGSKRGKKVNVFSESGVIDFFIINSANGPKYIMKKLTTITGKMKLPPFYSLGFHYSKWEETSALKLIDYDLKFE